MTVPGWGINLQNRGAYFSLDADHVNVDRAEQADDAHADARRWRSATASRGSSSGRWAATGKPQTHLQFLNRVIDDGATSRTRSTRRAGWSRPATGACGAESRFSHDMLHELERTWAQRRRTAGPYDSGMGHAHAIEVTRRRLRLRDRSTRRRRGARPVVPPDDVIVPSPELAQALRRPHPVLAGVLLLAAAAVWGFTFPLVKDALDDISPFEFLAIRFAIATLVLCAIFPRSARAALRARRCAGLIAGLLLALGHAFQTVGLEHTLSDERRLHHRAVRRVHAAAGRVDPPPPSAGARRVRRRPHGGRPRSDEPAPRRTALRASTAATCSFSSAPSCTPDRSSRSRGTRPRAIRGSCTIQQLGVTAIFFAVADADAADHGAATGACGSRSS